MSANMYESCLLDGTLRVQMTSRLSKTTSGSGVCQLSTGRAHRITRSSSILTDFLTTQLERSSVQLPTTGIIPCKLHLMRYVLGSVTEYWSRDRQKLRSPGFTPRAEDFPTFLWENNAPDVQDYAQGFLQSALLQKVCSRLCYYV